MEASHKKHRPHIKVGKDAEEEEEWYLVPVRIIDQTFDMHTCLRACVERKHMSKAGHRSTLRPSVFAFWHRASVYVRLSAFRLRIYATEKVRPVCVYVFENNACVLK